MDWKYQNAERRLQQSDIWHFQINLDKRPVTLTNVAPIIGSAIGNSRLLGNFVKIGIGEFQSYNNLRTLRL